MSMDYVFWEPAFDDEAAMFRSLKGVKDTWQINDGISRIDNFPGEAVFRMDFNFPHGIALRDVISNHGSLVVVSPGLKGFLQERDVKAVEYLPVGLLNHKGRPAPGGHYFIVNLLDPVDCLDLERCDVTYSDIAQDNIMFVENLVLDESKVDTERQLFSPKGLFAPLARRDLAEAITGAGFTGIRWIELEDFEM